MGVLLSVAVAAAIGSGGARAPAPGVIELCGLRLRLDKSELLHEFKTFDPADWTITRNPPKWTVTPGEITGGGPDEPTHGQVFYKTPVKGDVVLEFDARLVPPSYHDLVWLWNVRLDKEPWGAGYLGCLGGWWGDYAGIEKLPTFEPSAINAWGRIVSGRTYHVVSGSVKGWHFVCVDGKLVTFFADPAVPDPSQPGYFGFGVYESHAAYSNLKVWRPKLERGNRKYVPATRLERGSDTEERK